MEIVDVALLTLAVSGLIANGLAFTEKLWKETPPAVQYEMISNILLTVSMAIVQRRVGMGF